MVLALLVLALVTQQTILVRSQKVPASGGNKVAAQQEYPGNSGLLQCEFQGSNHSVVVNYSSTEYGCIKCTKRTRTLYQKSELKTRTKREICKELCNGILCGNLCTQIQHNGLSLASCLAGKAVVSTVNRGVDGDENEDGAETTNSQVPLIIGFTVGGLLLAIVVAGIFLGRQHKTDNTDGSEVATTPVSLSNSEWHSNGGSGSARRREENLRVQEASTEDLTALPNTIYAMESYKEYQKDENGNDFLLKATADTSSVGQESYRDDDLPFYYPQYGSELTRSNRSSDVVLEDGYVQGGNFVGSADPQVQRLLNQKSHVSPNETLGFEEHGDGGHFFGGKTPGSMTHDAICMSLTHSSNNYGEVEYVIEDQDLVAFDTPGSLAKQPSMVEMQVLNEDEDTMQLDLEYRDVDSDFEDHESRPNSTVKSDKSDVCFSSYTQSSDGEREQYHTTSDCIVMRYSPFSESGIEASCHSKDSSEVIPENASSRSAFRSPKSQNGNYKRRSNKLEMDDMKRRQNRVLAKGTNRSKSCSWKSPSTATHSCPRQQTISIHCPSSEPAQSRQRHSNLTHVFVDVHRNMASSDEDLLALETDLGRTYRNPSSTDSESSFSQIPLSAFQVTPDHSPYDATIPSSSSPATKIAKKQRNKSMYVMRNGGIKKTQNWAPRTVRFSSSGSGEYAIPFGSLVP